MENRSGGDGVMNPGPVLPEDLIQLPPNRFSGMRVDDLSDDSELMFVIIDDAVWPTRQKCEQYSAQSLHGGPDAHESLFHGVLN